MSPAFLSLSFSILALTIASCFADIVTLHKNHRGSVATLGSVGQVEDLHFLPPAGTTPGDAADNHLELLDIVLLASVDGKFHALNRVTGEQLWSMSSTATYTPQNNAARSVVSTLQPLVTTQHADRISDLDDDEFAQETYIIEPQSGDIYVSASPTGPLQRLPFSMSQLVDMSPFSFGDGDRRVFVGRRKTSLMVLELETGRIKAALDSECPWDPLEDFFDKDTTDYDVDLDELDGTKPPKQYPREIYIGRTDYHISIHTRPLSPSARRPPPQNLSFSTYGPNNQDLEQQASYRRTVDNTYVEPLPNGEVIAFKTHIQDDNAKENTFVWGQRFSSPIVTIFDVVKNPGRAQPFVLLQPRPRIEDVFPDLNLPGSKSPHTQNTESAYVGLVEETGSLFAMSPDHFPLVIFGGGEDRTRKTIDPPPGSGRTSHRGPSRELRCEEGTMDRRCAVGVRPLKSDSRSRLARLLDGAPANALPLVPPPVNAGVGGREPQPESPNMHTNSSFLPWPWPGGGSQHEQPLLDGAAVMSGMSVFMGLISFFVLGFGTLWGMRRRSRKQSLVLSSPTIQSEAKPSVEDVPNGVAIPDTPTPESDAKNPLIPASDSGQLPVVTVPEEQKGRIAVRIAAQEEGGEDESEKEGDVGATPGRRKPVRRRRGKKKKGAKDTAAEGDGEEPAEGNADSEEGRRATPPLPVPSPSPSRLLLPPTPEPSSGQSLVVSETILGFGSHGTVVYEGSLQGRAVAVKRLLQDFVTLAAREVSLLQDADDHPNVIRYYYQESHANFLYIALELCPASLADIIERPDQHRDIAVSFDAKRALRQITSGLRHLHALKIVHRDIKPQNILISSAKKGAGESAGHRMLISDFGLCRKLEVDQTSFLPTAGGAMGVGTFGWRAPEILRGDVKLDETTGDDHSQSSRDSVGTATGSSSGIARPTRLTKSVDIFALGCLFFYVLTNGGHPFGDRFEREVNILKNERRLEGLDQFGEEGSEAVDLISSMLEPQADHRPDTTTTLAHPYFWDPGRRLAFLQDASDRFEIMCRDPRDPGLVALEENAINVVGPDWPSRLDKVFVENLGKFRKYDPRSVQDLLRALRNKKHHYQDLPENVKRHVGPMPDGYLQYFTRRFPRLFLHVHSVIASSSLRHESMFRSYFDVRDS